MDTFTQLTPQQLRRAATVKEKIDSLQKELNLLLGAAASAVGAALPKRRVISPAGIARIRAAQKARWAAIRKAQGLVKVAPKRQRKISAAGRARLAALARARWAKVKASGKKAL